MKTYNLTVGAARITVQLTDEDANRYGTLAVPVDVKAAPAPRNKAREATTKEA